ncbi:hypothetical protein ACFE04_027872 [Oxalis oulophora]
MALVSSLLITFSTTTTTTTTALLLLLCLIGPASCDLAQDRSECTDKLMTLATCLSYVSGQSRAPTMDCCTGLTKVLGTSRKCLCILIKDKDDPNLGIKINATLAATLPNTCRASSNMTECITLLHLAPNSADAKLFGELAIIAGQANATTVASNTRSSPSSLASSSPSVPVKSGGGRNKIWSIVVELVSGILLCIFISI